MLNAVAEKLLPQLPKWEWDARFGCLVASFPATQADEVLAAIAQALPHEFGPANWRTATQHAIVEKSGGIQNSQKLFENAHGVYALWWPWRNGTTISLRIGVAGGDATAMQKIFIP